MPVERRGQVTDVGSEPTGNRRIRVSRQSRRKRGDALPRQLIELVEAVYQLFSSRRTRQKLRLYARYSFASVLLTWKTNGFPSALACSLTAVSFQPMRARANSWAKAARAFSFVIGVTPSGTGMPKMFAIMKLPTRALILIAP